MLDGIAQGPFQVSTRFQLYRALGVLLAAAGAVGCIGGYGYMARNGAQAILHDQRVWNEGGPELEASYQGKVTTRQFVLRSYELELDYRTPDGATHQKKLEVETLFGGLDEAREARVRVSKADPEDFALNLAVEASGSRWASVAFFLVVGIFLLGGSLGYLAFMTARQWLRVRRCAAEGSFALCRLVSREQVLNQGKPTGAEIFRFLVSGPGGEQEVKYQFRTRGSRALTTAGDAQVLALVPREAPQHAILVLETFYPVVLPEDVQQSLRAAVERAERSAA